MSCFFKYVGFSIYTIRIFLLAFIFLCPYSINAQSGVVVSGKHIENTSGSLSYTIGDVFYTKNIRGFSINEGMQQSYIINEIASKTILRVSLYPNPTNNFVYFKVENLNYKNLSFKLYDILQIDKNASQEEIKKKFKKLAVLNHPDKGGDPEKFKDITHAYEILSDETKRNQ